MALFSVAARVVADVQCCWIIGTETGLLLDSLPLSRSVHPTALVSDTEITEFLFYLTIWTHYIHETFLKNCHSTRATDN